VTLEDEAYPVQLDKAEYPVKVDELRLPGRVDVVNLLECDNLLVKDHVGVTNDCA